MIVYCPKSQVRLEVIPPVDSLDANAVIDYYENGELIDRAYAILDVALDADAPEPHEAVAGLIVSEHKEPRDVVESFVLESDKVYRIVNLYTLEAWVIVLDNRITHILLYQM
jgi:hypothetical protein